MIIIFNTNYLIVVINLLYLYYP